MNLGRILERAFQAPQWFLDLLSRFWLSRRLSAMGPGCRVLGRPILGSHLGSMIHLGQRVVLCSRSRDTALGVSRPVILRTLASGASIHIGDDSGLSGTTICAAQSVHIGRGCLVGADVLIADTDFHPVAPEGRRYAKGGVASAPVRIGDNVFLGARSMVLKGVTIGDNTVVGAGSVVTSDLPPNVIAAGNPARVLKPLPAADNTAERERA